MQTCRLYLDVLHPNFRCINLIHYNDPNPQIQRIIVNSRVLFNPIITAVRRGALEGAAFVLAFSPVALLYSGVNTGWSMTGNGSVRILLASIIAGVLCAAVPSVSLGALPEDAGDRLLVRDVQIDGLIRVPPETVLAVAGIKAGDRVTQRQLVRRVREAIKNVFGLGYFVDVSVFQAHVAPGETELTFLVSEKFVIRKIKLKGYDQVDEEDIRKAFTVRPGRFLDVSSLVETLRAIEELYQDKGYYLAETSWELEKDEDTRTVLITIKIREQEEVDIRRISFVGNKHVPDEDLKGFMQTREKTHLSFLSEGGLFLRYFFQGQRAGPDLEPMEQTDEFDASMFESWSAHQDIDLQRVKWLYMTKGYVEAKLGQPRIALTSDNRGIVITIEVDEGIQYDVGKVNIVTNDDDGLLFEKEELEEKLLLRKENVFNSQNVMMDTQVLSRKYMDKGYAFVSVSNTPFLDREKGILDLTYMIQKGNPTYVSSIVIVGNRSTADKIIRREMKLAEGQLFEQSKIDRSKALIFRLGFFENVEISNRPAVFPPQLRVQTHEGKEVSYVDLVVKVKERETGIFQVGAGFSSLESYLFQARIAKNNFLGRGQTLSFQALLSSLRSIYMVSFVEPYFMDTPVSFSVDLYDTATDYDAFTTEALGGNTSWGYRFLDDYFVYLTYKLERKASSLGGRLGYGGIPLEKLISKGLTTSLRASVAWDTRNNRIMPTEGFYHSLSFELATPYLGGQTDFYRSLANTRWYIPIFWKMILRLNGTLGYVNTESADGVPIFERFYVGGIFSVRGFHRNSLSPTILAASESSPDSVLRDFPLGGNKQLIFNAEIEIPIVREMGIVAVVFFDAGNAFAEDQTLSPFNLRTSTGFGFRWWSPMGPLRFEWGFPLKPEAGEDPMVFEFTIGSAF